MVHPVSLSLMLTIGTTTAGPWLSLENHLRNADVIIEIEIKGGGDIRVRKNLLSAADTMGKLPGVDKILVFTDNSSCWHYVESSTPLYALLFFERKTDGTLVQHVGVENNHGFYTSLNPHYSDLKRAIVASIRHQRPIPAYLLAMQTKEHCAAK